MILNNSGIITSWCIMLCRWNLQKVLACSLAMVYFHAYEKNILHPSHPSLHIQKVRKQEKSTKNHNPMYGSYKLNDMWCVVPKVRGSYTAEILKESWGYSCVKITLDLWPAEQNLTSWHFSQTSFFDFFIRQQENSMAC